MSHTPVSPSLFFILFFSPVEILFSHSEELHSLYRSPNTSKYRRLRWAGYVARMEEGTSAIKMLTGKPTIRAL